MKENKTENALRNPRKSTSWPKTHLNLHPLNHARVDIPKPFKGITKGPEAVEEGQSAFSSTYTLSPSPTLREYLDN
jgi:hypothetical protein